MNSVQAICLQISEEASEVSQAADKIMFFGPHEINPKDGISGLAKLVDELNDLEAAIQLLREELGEAAFAQLSLRDPEAIAAKRAKQLAKFQISINRGLITLTTKEAG